MGAYQLKITVKGTNPPIWRRVLVPDRITFEDLHGIIQTVFCWADYHLHEFEFKKEGIRIAGSMDEGDMWDVEDILQEDQTLIDKLLAVGKKFTYTYDFGDDWVHTIAVEKYLEDYAERIAKVLKYKGNAIPEDCGGVWGYYELLDRLNRKEDSAEEPDEDDDDEMDMVDDFGFWDELQVEYNMEEINKVLSEKNFPIAKAERKRPSLQPFQGLKYANQEKEDNKILRGLFDLSEDLEESEDWENQEEWEGWGEDIEEEDPEEDAWFDESADEFFRDFIKEIGQMDVSMEECLADMRKADILDLANIHHIKKCSGYKKADLIRHVMQEMLSETYMKAYFSCATDQEISAFERIISGEYYREFSEDEDNSYLEYMQDGGYLLENEIGVYAVPKEVREAYAKINTPDFQAQRKRTGLVFECLTAANYLYGITPTELVLTLLRQCGETSMTEADLFEEFHKLSLFRRTAEYAAEEFVDIDILDNGIVEDVRAIIKDVPYYIPSRDEIRALVENQGLLQGPEVEALADFLEEEMELDSDEAMTCTFVVYAECSVGSALKEVEEGLREEVLPPMTEFQRKNYRRLLLDVWEHARMTVYRGHMPCEVTGISVERPIFADLLGKGSKIYPNSPCPCGSGKKYKKCCGKNK